MARGVLLAAGAVVALAVSVFAAARTVGVAPNILYLRSEIGSMVSAEQAAVGAYRAVATGAGVKSQDAAEFHLEVAGSRALSAKNWVAKLEADYKTLPGLESAYPLALTHEIVKLLQQAAAADQTISGTGSKLAAAVEAKDDAAVARDLAAIERIAAAAERQKNTALEDTGKLPNPPTKPAPKAAANSSKCVGELQSPVYSLQQPPAGGGTSASFRFQAPVCADDAGGQWYYGGQPLAGHTLYTSGYFAWQVYLASTTTPAPAILFGGDTPPEDWTTNLGGDSSQPAPPVGCGKLVVTAASVEPEGLPTSGAAPIQIYFKVEWSSPKANTGPSCGASPPKTTSPTTTTKTKRLEPARFR